MEFLQKLKLDLSMYITGKNTDHHYLNVINISRIIILIMLI